MIRTVYPGYFALLIATGIVSLATHFLEMEAISQVLFYLNLIFYVVLWVLTILRFLKYRTEFVKDLIDHARGPGFFTIVAGTCVLGTQVAILTGEFFAARILWYLGILLWVVITYIFFTAVTVQEPKPSIENGLNGAW